MARVTSPRYTRAVRSPNLDWEQSTVPELPTAAVEHLKGTLQGDALAPGDAGYDEARQIWNAMIDRRPAVIARCATAADVTKALAFARDHGLALSIRGGGHNIAGTAMCDDGLVVDFSSMKQVVVDAAGRRAMVEPGATLGDVDAATQAHGLAVPTGVNSTTGIAGLTLGGGFGWLSRKYGMTIDNLLSADVVLADGQTVRASSSENPDLFWALRGGGGNYGIVTRFEFRLHPVGPDLLSGLIAYPFTQAKSVLQQYAAFGAAMPDELNVWAVLRKAPPLPFLPEAVHGTEVVLLALCYAGDPAAGQRLIEPLRGLTPGMRNYWKTHNFTHLGDGAIDAVIEYAGRLPSPHCEMFVAALGGQMSRVAPDATAYSARDATFLINVHGRWESAAEDERGLAWARGFFEDAKPYASAGAYVNFMTQDEAARVPSAYGPTYRRLEELKAKYDPANVFHVNQNIKPA
jgi:FAD/FMN-containing dehydrogenase